MAPEMGCGVIRKRGRFVRYYNNSCDVCCLSCVDGREYVVSLLPLLVCCCCDCSCWLLHVIDIDDVSEVVAASAPNRATAACVSCVCLTHCVLAMNAVLYSDGFSLIVMAFRCCCHDNILCGRHIPIARDGVPRVLGQKRGHGHVHHDSSGGRG